jgi:acyl-CoA synthetase (AMP-forming)/AMP-acid ligase II
MHQAQTRPKSAAFAFQGTVWTYERLAVEIESVARGLAMRGVEPGDRVALHMTNRPEMIVAYYACFRLGAIVAPLRTAFKFAELSPILHRLKPALYIGEISLYDNVAPVDASILAASRRIVIDGAFKELGVEPWEALHDAAGNESVWVPPAPDKPAVLITTSGTTGEPKFVVHTSATLSESTDLLIRSWGLSDDDIMIEPLPLAHMSGLITLLSFIQFGAPFVLLECFDADKVLDAIERHRCTWLLGFPAQYAAMLACQLARPRDLASLRVCLTGADVCPVDLQERVTSAFGAPLYNVWAATEVVGSLTFGLRPGPIARIVKGAQIRLIDENGVDVADGEVGELLVRGANVFNGYWNDPQATEQSLRGGWYHTGDLMRRGERDELCFVARKKDIIIRGGTNISPMEVEQALVAAHPVVREAAVVGVPDAVLGQRVLGFVTLDNGTKDTVISEIIGNLATRLASYKVPESLEVLDTLPRNALSKVDRHALQVMAAKTGKANKAGNAPIGARSLPPRQSDKQRARRAARTG